MAGQIFVEAHDVELLGLPIGAQHLYLVHRDANGAEYVIRSGPSGGWFGSEMEVEANVPIRDSADDRGDESPGDRHSTRLTFDGKTTDEAWAIMVKYARAIDAADYDYSLLEENSNAFIGAMVHAAGGDPDTMRPDGISAREAVGYSSWDEIVEDIAPPADGIFRGTAGNDRLSGLQIGEHVLALGGSDRVMGGRGDDRLEGGAGADILLGDVGADLLLGQAGSDTLDGGSGADRLLGGLGSDRFVLASPGRDRADDFHEGIDLVRVEIAGVDSVDDLAITASGGAGQHTLIAAGASRIELRNTDRALIDAGDFLFSPAADVLLA
jgi:RTX calcium-binding nonapeptide repeat (4 copies)